MTARDQDRAELGDVGEDEGRAGLEPAGDRKAQRRGFIGASTHGCQSVTRLRPGGAG